MKTRTLLAAEAIKARILRLETPNEHITIIDAREYGDSVGHHIIWDEAPFEWAMNSAALESDLSKFVFFMGCWLEPVNSVVLAVYPNEEFLEEARNDRHLEAVLEALRGHKL